MPVRCPIQLRKLSEEEFRKIDYEVMGHAFAAQRELGRLCDEEVYQNDLAGRLNDAGITTQTEVPITVSFGDFAKQYYLDLVADGSYVSELKAVSALSGEHTRQLLTYLLLLDVRAGKLINFKSASVEHLTVNAVLDSYEQRKVRWEAKGWVGAKDSERRVVAILDELVKDWGAFLELPLYESALVHFLGGDTSAVQAVPLTRNGRRLGSITLTVLDEASGLRLTASSVEQRGVEANLVRLLRHTPLRRMLWINFNRHVLEVRTLSA